MGSLQAGAAAVDITPDRGVPMSGYGARDEPATGVHEPLAATALALSDGATTVAVLSADLLNLSRELTSNVRRRLAATGASYDEVLLAATHTHGGPYVPEKAIDVNPGLAVEEDVSDTVAAIEQSLVDCLVAAYERLEPARLSIGSAGNTTTLANRRAEDRRGRIPTGDVDPELTVLDVETATGEAAVVVNFALHPVCQTPSDTRFSPDWPGELYRRVAEVRDGADVLFLNGAAGDVNPRGRQFESRDGDEVYAYMEAVGAEVAETAVAALADADDGPAYDAPALVTERRELRLPVKDLGGPQLLRERIGELDDEIERLETDDREAALSRVRVDRRYAEELLHLAEWGATELPATMQYVGVGPVGLLGMPGEAFVEHGLRFKRRAAAETLLPVGYANEYVGYLPTLAELENFGYEVWTTKVAPEAIVAFRDAGIGLVEGDG